MGIDICPVPLIPSNRGKVLDVLKLLQSLLCCSIPSWTGVCLVTCHSVFSRRYECKILKLCKATSESCFVCVHHKYNSWAAAKIILSKLDACHRHHLCSILSIHWPDTPCISNEALYNRCNTRPLSDHELAVEARWKTLGHVLR